MSARRAVLTAVVAATAGALLLGGNATYAAWSDSQRSGQSTITAGDLKVDISQTGPTAVDDGTNTSIYPVTGSRGIIPGEQSQRWTYTVTNSSASAVSADGTLEIAGAVSDPIDYTAVRPYLRASTTIGNTTTDIPNSAFTADGFQYEVDLDTKLQPSKSVTIDLTISMPATITNSQGQNVDVAVELLKHRSANTSTHGIFTMENSANLTQAG